MIQDKTIVTPAEIMSAMSGNKLAFTEYLEDTNQIIIRNITLNEKLIIDNIICQSSISFVNCDLLGGITIRGGKFNGFSISGGRITRPLNIDGGAFDGSFKLMEVDALNMDYAIYDSVNLLGGEFNCNILIYKGAYQAITIGGGSLKALSLYTGPISSHNHDLEPYIKKLTVSPKQIDIFEIDNFKVGHLYINGIFKNGVYSFSRLTLNQLEMRSFLNLGRVMFDDITIIKERDYIPGEQGEPTLSLVHSHLGRTRFSNIDMSKFSKVEISDWTVAEIESASDVKWFSPSQLSGLSNEAKRDLFRQLKYAMIRQGNRIDEMYFQAAEMDSYRKSLSFKANFGDLLILLIGKYTNNFGTDYFLPVIWIAVVSFLLFLCSIWVQGLPFGDTWANVFLIMNPAHPLDYLVPKEKLSSAFIAIDFTARILISILIYQLITPFRKFAR